MAIRRTRRKRLTPEQKREKLINEHARKAHRHICKLLNAYEEHVLSVIVDDDFPKTMSRDDLYAFTLALHQERRAKEALDMLNVILGM